jgi:curved DNA-binding protein CbpA
VRLLLTGLDHKIAAKYDDWDDIKEEIHGKLLDKSSTPAMKRYLGRIQPLPRTLSTLTRRFENLVKPLEPRFGLLWGMIYLNLKVSKASAPGFRNELLLTQNSSPTRLRTGSNAQQNY